jgi:hypothetical protein
MTSFSYKPLPSLYDARIFTLLTLYDNNYGQENPNSNPKTPKTQSYNQVARSVVSPTQTAKVLISCYCEPTAHGHQEMPGGGGKYKCMRSENSLTE